MIGLFKSNKLSNLITVIDIGSSKITCLIAKINEQNHEYEVIGNSQNISNGFRLGNVTNIKDLSTSIAKAVSSSEKMAGVSINKAHIVFNGGKQSSILHNSETPIVNGEITDNEILKSQESIILSMTGDERDDPKLINGSRKKRIASGSGTDISLVNKLLKQHKMMSNMMKKMSKGGNTELSNLKGIPPELLNNLK